MRIQKALQNKLVWCYYIIEPITLQLLPQKNKKVINLKRL